ncbi:MAG: glutamyl-tRNA synthetase, partial [Acidimicrobiales bacterium]|nr:glutamyl-tRNA synthetase [Acidimicrobiales bacterium]
EVQVFEDALCLVVLEDQLDELGARLDAEKSVEVLRKTLDKMSDVAIGLALELDLSPGGRALLSEAATRGG